MSADQIQQARKKAADLSSTIKKMGNHNQLMKQ
jgi:hypothetical protein